MNKEERPIYPYDVDDDDHCETPLQAYADIGNILSLLAIEKAKTKHDLLIYDPYFCEGNVSCHLNRLGFQNVYNRMEDFYQMQSYGKIPDYDILVTNPPYSGDHMEKLLNFCVGSCKPWFILVPNYMYTKDYYQSFLSSKPRIASLCFYVIPSKRYLYTTPKGRRQSKSGKYTAPFPTFWYCNIYRYTDKVLSQVLEKNSNDLKSYCASISTILEKNAVLVRTLTDLPVYAVSEYDKDHMEKKRQRNILKRKKHKKRKLNQLK
jgi:hypothetical protein